ncbi:hypothetical protein C0583_04850 [Candidatus Parcubacteria bacterium]|nr:MAG: hypothetical protein C0583_04850 [Candidatus Parcubacteria bacterium]
MNYKLQITSYKFLLIILAIVVIIILFFLFLNNNDSEVVVLEEPTIDEGMEYSRISFFNSSSKRASMAIPVFWEGNYRLKEEGDVAVFYFLDSEAQANEIFKVLKKNDKSGLKDCSDNTSIELIRSEYSYKEELKKYLIYFDKIVDSLECS